MTTQPQRQHLERLMRYLISKEPQIHYAEIRPMRTIHMNENVMRFKLDQDGAITMDCSEAVTCLCKWAGLHDPNGLSYDGAGFTGTLLQHLPHYSKPSLAMVGALVVFGPGSGEHVCMVLERGQNPLLFSHGMERGPLAIRLSAERKWHNLPVTFLSIAGL